MFLLCSYEFPKFISLFPIFWEKEEFSLALVLHPLGVGGNIHSRMGPFHPGRKGTLNFKLYGYPKFYDHVPICWIITLGTFIHSVLIGWNKQDCSIIWIHKMDINKKGYISTYRLLSHLSRSLYFFASSCASAYNILNYLCIFVDTCFRNVTTALAHYRQIL